jgi:Mg-chelatase subunit ChlD
LTLLQPIWLFLLIPLGAALWRWPLPSRLLVGLRIAGLLLLVAALSGLAWRLPSRAGTVVVVADRSLSMPPGSEAAQKEVIDLVQAAMGSEDRLAVVSFGQTTAIELAPGTGRFAGFVNEVGRDASNLAEALEASLALIPRDGPGKVLILSDGRWTGRDPAAVASRAAARGVAIDYRLQQRPAASDLAVARIEAPAIVHPGESFMISAWVQTPVAQDVSFELRRGPQVLASGRRSMVTGLNRLTFRDRAGEPGNQAYTLNVTGSADDPVPENNTARILVGVSGPRPLLYVTASPRSNLPRLLEAGRLQVKMIDPEHVEWSLEELSRYAGVLIENVPAEKIGATGMETLAAWVPETGAGLMLTGGQSSYGPGGYYQSPLDPILPVSMELRNEHRKLSLAIVVALDRSGSMAMPVGGGRQKMDLANLGTVAVLDLLSAMDEFGVIAVDTEPHIIADLSKVENKERVRRDVLKIQSMGGGIYVYVALEAALKMILPAKSGTKHIVLFADAADAEEPGHYEELIERCNQANVTVSVIGLGTEADKDADLLKDIARRGKGRAFFTNKPEELPRVFAQDTFVVARSTFLEEPTPVKAMPGLAALTGKPFEMTQPLGGYNLCYLRPEATLAAVTVDDYEVPVVAAWHAGLGRVLCYTGEVDGKHTGAFAKWNEVGDFFSSLARWTTGPSGGLPETMMVTQETRNGVNVVQLHLDPDRKSEPFTGLPRVTVLRGTPGQAPRVQKMPMSWTGTDSLAADVLLAGDETALATVEIPGQEPVALPPVCLPYSPEFKPVTNDTGLAALDKLSRSTAGKERVEVAGIWKELPRRPRLISLAPWLPGLAVALLLLEVLERRTGVLTQHGQWLQRTVQEARAKDWRFRKRKRRAVVPPGAMSAPGPAPAEEIKTKVTVQSIPSEGMLDALRKARQRSRERTQS